MKKSIYFRIGFDRSWILEQKNSRPMPVDKFVAEFCKHYELFELRTRLTGCEAVIKCDKDKENITEEILSVIGSAFGLADPNAVCFIECEEKEDSGEQAETDGESTEVSQPAAAEETSGGKPADGPAEAEKKPAEGEPQKKFVFSSSSQKEEEKAEKSKTVDDVMKQINSLIGANEFKVLADECVRMAPLLKANDTLDSFTNRAYLISINEGCGLSTYLELFKSLVEKLELMEFQPRTEPFEVRLCDPKINSAPNEDAVKMLRSVKNPKLICLDISEYMSKLNTPEFRDILKEAEKASGNHIVFFRIPFVEQNIIDSIRETLNDMLFIKAVSIPPFDTDELIRSAQDMLAGKKFSMEEGSWDVFEARVAAEKSDGRFYGIETVKKIVREMLYVKQLYNVDNNISDNVIKREEITGLVDASFLNNKNGFEQLSELIGMDSIVEKVKEIVAQIEAAINNDSLDNPCIHMRFVGNPGTGKTTVARILGQIMKEKGILRNGGFFEYSGRDLCGSYVGHTAPKTSAICRDAYGSVLFIDEAYSLYRGDGFGNVDYGREALDTLVAEMENHRSDLMVIMAGYPKEMEELMEGNVGLKSRMPYMIEFPNYSREQLTQIFISMAKKGFEFDQDFEDAVRLYFDSLSDIVLDAKDFSNGRYVRNLFERTWGKAALRCQLDRIPCKKLTVEDFELAAGDKDFSQKLEKKKRTIGFN